jgi:two-component system chemotaxis response regulator CheB
MAARDVVVIGASAGGLQALSTLIGRLPDGLNACVLVVMHSSANSSAVLPTILSSQSLLPVAYAMTGDPLAPGRICVSRPDYHLVAAIGSSAGGSWAAARVREGHGAARQVAQDRNGEASRQTKRRGR